MPVPVSSNSNNPKNSKAFPPRRQTLVTGILIICLATFLISHSRPAVTHATIAGTTIAELDESNHLDETNAAAAKLAVTPSIWPAKGPVTSGFGWRISPFGDGNELHAGIDIASSTGAPVVATADGQVIHSGWAGGYGNMVQIDHGNGISTVYGHNSQIAVSVGDTIKKGQVISYAGSTGKSTGPHVHYEVRVGNSAVDPWKYLVLY